MYKTLILLFVLMSFSSCTDCKDRNCENGFCLGDRCICDEGYNGDNCQHKKPTSFVDTGIGFYTTCSTCVGLSVSVDGGNMRTFDYYFFSPTANCGHEEVIRFNLSAGTHSYATNDGRSGNFIVEENQCKTIRID